MASDEGVVFALAGLGKARHAAVLPEGGESVRPARQQLVDVGLMAHVKNQPIFRGVEHLVKRDCQLNDAQIGGQMAAGLRDVLY